MLFEWKPGDTILFHPDYKYMIPLSNHTTNEGHKGTVGHDVIVFGEEERDITDDNISEDESVGECNEQDDEGKTEDTRDNTDGGIEEL